MLGPGIRDRRLWAFAGVLLILAVAALGLLGCGSSTTTTTVAPAATTTSAAPTTTTAVAESRVILASTTSTQDTGLFDSLLPVFQQAYPQYNIQVVAVGSGAALKMGETKDADVLLVHSPAAEKTYMDGGFGIERKAVMYNDFVLVGPASDPAKIKGVKTASEALKKIAAAQAPFINRGDDSGTDAKEKSLWTAAGITPSGAWYQKTGQGMSASLRIAAEKGAYILSDRGTYLTTKDQTKLVIMVEGDQALLNQYHVITVTGAKNPAGAKAFADWIVSPEGQDAIKSFGIEKYGQSLFTPNAGSAE